MRNIFWYTQAVKEKMQHLNFAKIDMYCIPIRAAKCLREHIILHIYLVKKWPIIVIKTYTSEKKKVLACKSELIISSILLTFMFEDRGEIERRN